MAFDKVFNKLAGVANAMNKTANKVIGKDVFGEVRPIEKPRVFADYNSLPSYEAEEPPEWNQKNGSQRIFPFAGESIIVPEALDSCILYKQDFLETADYYAERFKYKYSVCVNDFDTLVHYFEEMYTEGLIPMLVRACSLLLPFGVFDAEIGEFTDLHLSLFHRAITSYENISGIEKQINKRAEEAGNSIGNAVRLRGGGFGVKGAAKGIAMAEGFNFGMGLLGKLAEHQMTMTPEQKSNAYNSFKVAIFFEEVQSDYKNTFRTFMEKLSDQGLLGSAKAVADETCIRLQNNLCNTMFPKERIPSTLANLISRYPFEKKNYLIAQQLLGETEELKTVREYFSIE